MTAYEEGADARYEGADLDENPYTPGTEESTDWARGWRSTKAASDIWEA
jgi:hypothetical protein